nr:MAG TPA: hypothetical protein [Caudoviricetes sp.]
MRPFLLCVTGNRKATVQLVPAAKINAKALQEPFCRVASIMLPHRTEVTHGRDHFSSTDSNELACNAGL